MDCISKNAMPTLAGNIQTWWKKAQPPVNGVARAGLILTVRSAKPAPVIRMTAICMMTRRFPAVNMAVKKHPAPSALQNAPNAMKTTVATARITARNLAVRNIGLTARPNAKRAKPARRAIAEPKATHRQHARPMPTAARPALTPVMKITPNITNTAHVTPVTLIC